MISGEWTLDVGVLILRLVIGLTLVAHGCSKFFGKGGIRGTASWFDSIGMRPGAFHARMAATFEILAGLGLAVGVVTPIPAAGFVALMIVAAWTAHRQNGFFSAGGGWEYELVLAVSAVVVALMGAGRISLDYLLLHGAGFVGVLAGWWGFAIALVLGLAGGVGQLVLLYRPSKETSSAADGH